MALKLAYFDIRGLGEPIRLLLVDNNIEFEDQRIKKEQWPEIKPKMIFGQVPCLYTEGREIVQSAAILRHLGRVHGLNGRNESETTFIDMFYEGIRDLDSKYATMFYNDYENGKEKYINETLPAELAKLEKLFKTHKNGEQFVAGDQVTYVDYMLFEELDIHLYLTPKALDSAPALKKFHERFAERPLIKAYLKERAILNPTIFL